MVTRPTKNVSLNKALFVFEKIQQTMGKLQASCQEDFENNNCHFLSNENELENETGTIEKLKLSPFHWYRFRFLTILGCRENEKKSSDLRLQGPQKTCF